jgi:hypothetical protein
MSFRSSLLVPAFLAALGFWSCAQPIPAADLRPNIILIMVDDLGYADISLYGQRKIQTPNLANLAERGMIFTQYYAGVSVCAPSRSSLMEGLHTGHTFIRGNKQNDTVGGQWPIPEDTVTIANVLQTPSGKVRKSLNFTTMRRTLASSTIWRPIRPIEMWCNDCNPC